jgi:hypothetical protein
MKVYKVNRLHGMNSEMNGLKHPYYEDLLLLRVNKWDTRMVWYNASLNNLASALSGPVYNLTNLQHFWNAMERIRE